MQWLQNDLPGLLSTYGYGAVVVLLALESIGFPVPGATVLVATAVYAGATQGLDIVGVVAAASMGAMIGDNLAYWIGRSAAFGLLRRYGRFVGFTDRKLRLGAYLFQRHGGKVVFLARLVAFLRVVTMYVAGISRMDWHRFVMVNLAGSVTWALVFGIGAYFLGQHARRLTGLVSLVLLSLGIVGIATAAISLKRHLERLSTEADLVLTERSDPLV
jgi:membrane protein DedA with SNARE-associated domain